MKKVALAFVFVAAVAACGRAHAGEELTGIAKLACEARLCLSTGAAPAECSPALTHYYSIHGDNPGTTAALRQAFLNNCPLVGQGPVNETWETRDGRLVQVAGSGQQIIAVDNDGYLVSLGFEDVAETAAAADVAGCEPCGSM